ncbi:MAG: cytochrome c biogenesis protein CcsA [Candidatus Poribacteria bacterium]|nr:cytochrome c biogenesis protein CcsA [Candidatus Poribacteria bacterium]
MNFLFFHLLLLAYLAASILHILFLTTRSRKVVQSAYWVTTSGFVLHSVFIALRWQRSGHFWADWYDSTSFLAWALILIYLCITHLTHLRTIGVFVVPAAFISIVISFTLQTQENTEIPAYLQNYWFVAHSTFIFLAYAAFIAAFGFGLMYLIEEKKIREKQHTVIHSLLPALGRLDELGHRCIIVGLILLTMGIIIGGLWTRYVQGITWKWIDPKVVFTIATWLIYALQLSIRQILGWRGRKTAYSAIVGFGAILFTYVGVNVFLPSTHAF